MSVFDNIGAVTCSERKFYFASKKAALSRWIGLLVCQKLQHCVSIFHSCVQNTVGLVVYGYDVYTVITQG